MSDDPRQILDSFGDRIVHSVLAELGSENVESIFISGSAARGEIAAFSGPEGIEVYSDLDLFVVVRGSRRIDEMRREARRAAENVGKVDAGYRIFPDPDIGVFSREDLLSQKARPGTVEIAGSHVVLHGEDKAAMQTGGFVASAIDPSEALYLVENRLAELAMLSERFEKDRSEGFRRYLFYVLSKSCLDAVTAVLIVLGRFHPSRGERMKRFRDARSTDDATGLVPGDAVPRIERCYGNLMNLQEALEAERGATPDLRNEVESVLLGVWKGAAERVSALGEADWSELIDWRCKRGRWLGNSRELWVLARRMGVPRARVVLRCGALARLSPVDLLRLSGTVEALLRSSSGRLADRMSSVNEVEKRYLGGLDSLTRAFGYAAGPVFQRALRLFGETA